LSGCVRASITAQLAPASKIQLLDLSPRHLHALNGLPFHEQHPDPFDHLIIAQAIVEGMTLVTRDRNAALYPVPLMTP
jgi:PIN domain nuclease of toxin-antitoxin system